ncbi:hypothetical protein CHS0354_033826 [Potamilus streckersoni]|uniref:Uncharacterized protein n=1 Tax=Potamilus streckersoni TaxID=2493646 RepID=A0AAE0T7P1_9BIVA|nr:hypothetical protein CHS0354_033826 [Potamilus streckersoni]
MLKNSVDTQIATNKNLEDVIDDQKDEIKLLQERANKFKVFDGNPAEILQFKYKIGLLENEVQHLKEKIKNKKKKIDSLKKLINETKTEPPKQDELKKVINELDNIKTSVNELKLNKIVKHESGDHQVDIDKKREELRKKYNSCPRLKDKILGIIIGGEYCDINRDEAMDILIDVNLSPNKPGFYEK